MILDVVVPVLIEQQVLRMLATFVQTVSSFKASGVAGSRLVVGSLHVMWSRMPSATMPPAN